MKKNLFIAIVVLFFFAACSSDTDFSIPPCDPNFRENLPEVSTDDIVNDTTTLSLICLYTIKSRGSAYGRGLLQSGICFSTINKLPSILDSTISYPKEVYPVINWNHQKEVYLFKYPFLGKKIYIRAFATNCAGTSYGDVISIRIPTKISLPDALVNLENNMVPVKGGSFTMGSELGMPNEKPEHKVTLDDYKIGKFEVTLTEWWAVMGFVNTPIYFSMCPQCPVIYIKYEEILTFLKNLSSITDKPYRLPTEAEWEYAARGGIYSHRYKYAGSNVLDEVGWYHENSEGGKTVFLRGLKAPNELGLYDMSGNVHELCSDWYSPYDSTTQRNPKGPDTGERKVIRGGSSIANKEHCKVTSRNSLRLFIMGNYTGFRLAL